MTIERGAIQWRARWRCEGRGPITVYLEPAPRTGAGSHSDRCPGRGTAGFTQDGRSDLHVDTGGRWRVRVEQQVTSALREQPLPGMREAGARVVAQGSFRRVERRARGRAKLYELESGRLALRMEGFDTAANTDLFVWLSEAPHPRTTRAAFRAPHVEVAPLKSTLGEQNYLLPRGIERSRIRSIVIWCEPLRIAYAVAPLSSGDP